MTLIRTFLAALLLTAFATGQSPEAAPVAANIVIDLLIVTLPEELAFPLVDRLSKPETVDAACLEIEKLIAEKKATLVAWPRTVGKSGERATSEKHEEIRYATAYEPPAVGWATAQQGGPAITVAPKIDLTLLEGIPRDFETRNIGVSLETEAVLGEDGKLLNLNISATHSQLLGYSKVTIEKSPDTKVTVEQPRFHTITARNSLRLQSGSRLLLAVQRVPLPADHFELFILRATVVPARPAAAKTDR